MLGRQSLMYDKLMKDVQQRVKSHERESEAGLTKISDLTEITLPSKRLSPKNPLKINSVAKKQEKLQFDGTDYIVGEITTR